MKLSELMMVQGIRRWHIVDTSRSQSVAEHSFNVAMIAGEFASYFVIEGKGGEAIAGITMMALLHDIDEVYLGDVPSIAKKEPVLKDKFEDRAVQIADKLDAYWFANHYAIGPRAEFVKADTRKRFLDLVQKCNKREQQAWSIVCKEVLSE